MSDTQVPTQTYKASCHCGAFAYNVTTASLDNASTEVVRCNCSICTRNGYLLIYVPNDQSYTFASHKVAHYFCSTCGSSCMARSISPGFFDGMSIVNVRLFESVELEKLRFKEMDGRSYTPEAAKARVAEIQKGN
ncbi:carbon-sulfur lyase [Ascochyta rabiei]|uniref:Carbon-sulfur lyase n=1 Tax=Didymella rabiei TaxID=5454 RepID=A0A163KTT3_DIDRA|nr:carbon-sulfur lyase [Ascochyta rabiei]